MKDYLVESPFLNRPVGHGQLHFCGPSAIRNYLVRTHEWHGAKAEANWQTHGVSFELARTVFKDPLPSNSSMDREDYGEERFAIVGMGEGPVLLFVAYTERDERIRIIAARRVTRHEKDDYFRQNTESPPVDERRIYRAGCARGSWRTATK